MSARLQRLWLVVLPVTALINQFTVNVVRPSTTYKIDAMGGDATLVGVVTATYAVIPLVTAMSVGRLVQRLPALSGLMAAGLLTMTVGAGAIALSPAVWGVLLGTALLGLGQLVFTIGGQSAVSRAAEDDKVDSAFGWFTAGVSAGQMLGPLAAGWIMSAAGSSDQGALAAIDASIWFGAAVTVPGAAVLLLMSLVRRRSRRLAQAPEPGPEPDLSKASPRAILRRPRVASHIVASAALLALTDILIAFVPLLGQNAGLSPTAVGVLLALRGVGSLSSRLLLGVLTTRIPREILLIISLFASALCFSALPPLLDPVWAGAGLMCIGGFFLGLGQPLTMAMVTLAVPAHWRPPALALRLVGNRLGQVAIPLAAGTVAGPVGPGGAVWLGGALLLASGVEQTWRARNSS